jgi:membrane-associated PAP2 superfamily phosphatase
LTWLKHAVLPAVAAALALASIQYTHLYLRIADLFYDVDSARWIGANTWWASTPLRLRGGCDLLLRIASSRRALSVP